MCDCPWCGPVPILSSRSSQHSVHSRLSPALHLTSLQTEIVTLNLKGIFWFVSRLRHFSISGKDV